MDSTIVESLNRWFAATPFRADLDRALALAPLFVIAGLVVLSWLADWGRAPERRAIIAMGVLAAIVALALNVALGHFYYRPRPFLVLPVHALLPHAPDSSLYSDHLAAAGALTAALLVARRWVGALALLMTFVLAVARVGAAVHYPSDVIVGAVVGATCFALLLPLRRPVSRLIGVMAQGETAVIPREPRKATFLFRHGPLVSVALLVVVAGLGYGLRALQDHGRIEAGARAEAVLQSPPPPRPPDAYPGTSIDVIAGGHYAATHAAVVGDVTQVTRELDGDIHLRVEGSGAFIVAEIIPEFPLPAPHVGQEITAWGIVRHDGIHNWWELHPLIGWSPGGTVVPGSPGPGTGD
jgi:undecaprenyl-diphosphatase